MSDTEPSGARCPECGHATRAITTVTVPALGDAPRKVLVTRVCTAEACQSKFPIFKSEHDLTEEERRVWTRR